MIFTTNFDIVKDIRLVSVKLLDFAILIKTVHFGKRWLFLAQSLNYAIILITYLISKLPFFRYVTFEYFKSKAYLCDVGFMVEFGSCSILSSSL